MRSIVYYIREFLRPEWLKKFFFAKTAPLVTTTNYKDYPTLTDKDVRVPCAMICPAPGGIEVLRRKDQWVGIYPGHCIRCGLCRGMPEGVLTSADPRRHPTRLNGASVVVPSRGR